MFGKSLGKAKSKTHKTALCIIPPQKAWSSIQAIRKKRDRQFRRWMPHINLLYPFKPKSEFSLVMDLLVHTCSQIKPIEISLNEIHYFKHGDRNFTIWLKADPEEPILHLQQKVSEMVPECSELSSFAGGFTPHLSIGQCKGKEKARQLIRDLQANWKPLRFQISEVSLIWRKDPPNDKFRVAETIPLGK